MLLALTTPVQFWVGWPFHAAFVRELRHRSASMNTLVSIGTGAAYFFSLAVTLWPHRFMATGAMPYYEASALLITFLVLGRWLEARARGGASDAIRRLVALQPRTARVLRAGGEVDVPIASVAVGRPAPRPAGGARGGGRDRGGGRVQRGRVHADRREPAGGEGAGSDASWAAR